MPVRDQFGKRPDPSKDLGTTRQDATPGTHWTEFRIELPDWKPGPVAAFLMAAIVILGVTLWLPVMVDNHEKFQREYNAQQNAN